MKNKSITIFILFFLVPLTVVSQEPFQERLTEIDSTLTKLSRSEVPGLKEMAEFSVVSATIQELLRGAAEAYGLNVSVSPDIKSKVTNNFTNVSVKDLVLFLCEKYELDIDFIGNIMSFNPYEAPQEEVPIINPTPNIIYDNEKDLLTVDLKNDSVTSFVRELTTISGKNIILAPNVKEQPMNGLIKAVPFDIGLEKIAFANSLVLEKSEEEDFYILKQTESTEEMPITIRGAGIRGQTNKNTQSRKNNLPDNLFIELTDDSLLNVEAINIPVADIINEAAYESNKNYIFFSVPEGSTFLKVSNINFSDLLDFLLQGTNHTYINQKDVYIIGNRLDEGFRTTKLVKFQHRTMWEIQASIPPQLIEDIQILPFEELNALILSGSSSRIKEVEKLLIELDQPVPNIMISVMVIEVNKNKTTDFGISAAFGDSTKTTRGNVFPDANVTVGAKTINSFLEKVHMNNFINLGKVNSNFYLTIKALEENGNIKVNSTPKLSTLNGHEATMTIGRSVYYKESTQNVTGGVNPIITTSPRFNKVDANLSLRIVPIVSGNDNITLDIEAEFSDFIPPEIEDAPPGNATRKFVSQIRILNQETILLGGLEEVSKEKLHSGTPLLSKIPIIKWLFSRSTTKNSESKLLILISPEIVF
nr:hypothetical protein [uncultured Draconibacterium sp.]